MSDASVWNGSWAWALPLLAVTVIVHVIGLGAVNVRVLRLLMLVRRRRHFVSAFALVMGVATLWATFLHAIEASIWAVAFQFLGGLPDGKTAMLYSLSAFTTYGHAALTLAPHWQLMGAIEALNGIILIGLTTAFLYGALQRVWPINAR
jgi:hypothetical protein